MLPRDYWSRYDRSPAGLSADLHLSDLQLRSLGSRSVVSHAWELSGTGPQAFRDTALVTHLLDAQARPLVTLVVAATAAPKLAMQLDYVGYPVDSMPRATDFYQHTMAWGTPYRDTDWRGWWSGSGSVLGIYPAVPADDGLPRPGVPSGYLSLWVRSAREAEAWLQKQGSTFPAIPAINDGVRGRTRLPGYEQVVGTDTEGNVLILTQYTGA